MTARRLGWDCGLKRRPGWGAMAAALAALVIACSPGAPSASDPDRERLLGAIPPATIDRGVYAFTAPLDDELSPGSLLAPVIGAALTEADLVVETGAPPLLLALGIERDDLPAPAQRVGDVVVLGAPDDVEAARARLESGAQPQGRLAQLAAVDAPVAWAGPPPTRENLDGDVVVSMDDDAIQVQLLGATGPENVANAVREALQSGAPPQSPGKRWSTLLVEPDVSVDGDAVVVEAQRGDVPGALLRQLIDSRSLIFLSGGVG